MQARSIDGVLQWGATISATNHIATAISATTRRYRPQQKTISTTRKINIGHNHIGHKIYGEFIWRHRVDTSLFRVGPVRIVNLNVKPRIRPIGQKESYRPTSPVIEKMNVRFFKPANILLGYRCLLFPHSRHSISCPA